MRSSSEWKLITARRAPGRQRRHDGGQGQRQLQTVRGSRKSEGPGTSAWPDPDANHPACACRWLAPRAPPVAGCRRWVRAREPPQLLLQSIEQTVLHHSRAGPPSVRAPWRGQGIRQRIRRATGPSACRADRRGGRKSRASRRRSAARRFRDRAARRRPARAQVRQGRRAVPKTRRGGKRNGDRRGELRRGGFGVGIAVDADEAPRRRRAARGSPAHGRRGRRSRRRRRRPA